jgi:hypothetical protein
MFNNSSEIDYLLDEGVVTEVDIVNRLCRVKTLRGQNLNAVPYLGDSGSATRAGTRSSPALGSRAILHSGLGYPLIIGFLPKLQAVDGAFPVSIDTGEQLVNTGSFSPASASVILDQNSPNDMSLGDNLTTSTGGGLLGVLRGGSILMRASRLAEIYVCKWDDLVRIVSRNWQHFTDVGIDVIYNLRNRVYRYAGYAQTFADSRTENYKYNQIIGDVSLGEVAMQDQFVSDDPTLDNRIFKEEIVTGSSVSDTQLMKREIHLDGSQEIIVKNADSSLITRIYETNGVVTITSSNGDNSNFTKVNLNKDEVQVTYKDVNVIKINNTQINLTKGSGPIINMTDSGITADFSGGEIKMHSGGIDSTFSGHFVKISSSGVALG